MANQIIAKKSERKALLIESFCFWFLQSVVL